MIPTDITISNSVANNPVQACNPAGNSLGRIALAARFATSPTINAIRMIIYFFQLFLLTYNSSFKGSRRFFAASLPMMSVNRRSVCSVPSPAYLYNAVS